ncbi:MAG TPA: hypothetical protein VIZ20_22140, partial [Streptosporangiaceae bacterium]
MLVGAHSATDRVRAFQHRDRDTGGHQIKRTGQPRNPGTHNDYRRFTLWRHGMLLPGLGRPTPAGFIGLPWSILLLVAPSGIAWFTSQV